MDFAALASRMAAGLEGVRACLIVSGDGLSLGAYPDHAEPMARSVWERLSAVGDPQRGFFSVGDELWVVARRGWYAALLIAAPTVKPGLVLDRLESYLRTAEESRIREAAELTGPPGATEPPRRLRTPLHREPPAPRPTPPAAPAPSEPPPVPDAGPSSPLRSQEGLPPRALGPPPPDPTPTPTIEAATAAPAEPRPAPSAPPRPQQPAVEAATPVSPPAPEPPPVARPEPETEAPRPRAAGAAPDPPSEARVEAPEPRRAAEEVAPIPVPAEVVVDMTGRKRRAAEPEAVGTAAPESRDTPTEREPLQDVKGDPSKTEVDKVALTREFSQLFGEVDGSEQG